MSAPLAAIGVNELQLTSGVGVLPGAHADRDAGARRGVLIPGDRAPVDRLAGVEDARGERARGRVGAHVQPVDRERRAAGVEVAGGDVQVRGEPPEFGVHQGPVDEVFDLARFPLDAVAMRGADVLAERADRGVLMEPLKLVLA